MSLAFTVLGVFAICSLLFIVLVIRSTLARHGRLGINVREKSCEVCGWPSPGGPRIPANLRQTLWGGWTCSNCGTESDKWGKPIKMPAS